MGADFLLTAVPKVTPTQARERLAQLTDQEVLDAMDVVKGFADDPEEARDYIRYAIDAILAGDEPNDTGTLWINHQEYIVTGGMSWGDGPTESFDDIWLLDYSGVCDPDPRGR